jgi:hypothetical protein
MATVAITLTTLGFSVKVNKRGELLDAPHIYISNYVQRFKNIQYDQQLGYRVVVGEYFYFDIDHETCYFPRYDLEGFQDFLKANHVTWTNKVRPAEKGKDVEFLMLPHIDYKNDAQRGCVEFLTKEEGGSQRAVALQTGKGKTVAYIWSLQKLGVRSLTTMTSRLDQWVREFGAYTTVDPDDIYIVAGVASLTKLFTQIDKTIFPKVILASAKTIRNYIEYGPTYQHLPHPSLMCEQLGIGIVGTDEYHEHFYTNFLIGIMLNPALFIPITATFLASDPFVKSVFDKFVPREVQFYGGDYEKYVAVTAYQYRSPFIQTFAYQSPRGYSQQIFEKWLLNRGRKILDNLVQDAFIPIIREHYINIAQPGEKFLFLCSSTKLCDHLVNIFARQFPDKKVIAFYSGVPESVLKEYDMILSTPGSSGTGRDIKGLRTCFVFESVDSETRNLQFIGRLRGPPQMLNTPEYCYVSFMSIPAHARVHQKRALLLGSRAKTFKHRTI